MSCKEKEDQFTEALKRVQTELETELAQVALEAEKEAEEVFSEFERERDLAEGVGAAAGTAIGGMLGGPAGAAAGAALGKTIGGLFTIDVSHTDEKISLDIPAVTMKDEEWSFDVPAVVMKNNDIIFDLPTMVMERRRGPDIPHTKIKMVTKCTGGGTGPFGIKYPKVCTDVPEIHTWYEKTYIDVPVWKTVENRIVIGVPEVEIRTQSMLLTIPTIDMQTQEIIFRVPSITIRFIKDAGKKAAEAAANIAIEAERESTQKRIALKELMVLEVVDPAKAMFQCYKDDIQRNKNRVMEFYDPEISKLTSALSNLHANNVPEDDDDYQKQKSQLDEVIKKRNEAEASFNKALDDLINAEKESLENLLKV